MTLTSREPGPTASPTAASLPGVDSSTLTRGLYSTDASLYRVVPQGVAVPRDRAELEGLVDAALRAGVPVTLRELRLKAADWLFALINLIILAILAIGGYVF